MSANSNFLKSLGVDVDSIDSKALEDRKKTGKGCIECSYRGYALNSDGNVIICSCAKSKMLKDIYVKSNLPRKYWYKTIEDWNVHSDSSGNALGSQQSVSTYVKKFVKFYSANISAIVQGKSLYLQHSVNVKSKLHSILFVGNQGSGKSFINSVIAQSAINQSLTTMYYEWSDLSSLMSDFDNRSEIDDVKEIFATYELICIDGVEHISNHNPFFNQSLDRICKARLNSGYPTVISSNGTHNQISQVSGWTSILEECLNIPLPSVSK
jgi:DNA replication protein DnaC